MKITHKLCKTSISVLLALLVFTGCDLGHLSAYLPTPVALEFIPDDAILEATVDKEISIKGEVGVLIMESPPTPPTPEVYLLWAHGKSIILDLSNLKSPSVKDRQVVVKGSVRKKQQNGQFQIEVLTITPISSTP
jgi:hypothetical protein